MTTKVITIELTLDQDEYDELMEHEHVQGNLNEFLFAELCQNYGMGMLTNLTVVDKEE